MGSICMGNHNFVSKFVSTSLMRCSFENSEIDLVNAGGNPSPLNCNNASTTIASNFMSHFEGIELMSPFNKNNPFQVVSSGPRIGETTITGISASNIQVRSCCREPCDSNSIFSNHECDTC